MPTRSTKSTGGLAPDDVCELVGAPISDWLRAAILENVRRDPLLAAEDAIVLVDIVTVLSRDIMTVEQVVSNPLIGKWLKQAVLDAMNRPLEQALRDAEVLRDILAIHLFEYHWSGKVSGPDAGIRMRNIIHMINGFGGDALAQWSQNTAAYLKLLSAQPQAGLAEFQQSLGDRRAGGHDEMADIFEQLSDLSEAELQEQLRAMVELLSRQDRTH